MDPAHGLGVALREVVVRGDDVHAVPGQRVQVGRHHTGQGLALTGAHLGDVAEVQRGAAHQLDVIRPLAEHAFRGLTDRGERLGEQVVERLALGQPLTVLLGQVAQLVIREVSVLILDRIDGVRDGLEPPHHPAFTGAEDSFQNRHGSTLPTQSAEPS